MKLNVEGLDVYFPYEYVYKEQYDYMVCLKRSLDLKGHAMLEMPTGTGKTVCLLSLITSYQYAHPATGKLIYCTRTVSEMEKCIEELKAVLAYRDRHVPGKILAVSLSSRRNLCIHPRVMEEGDREAVDSMCRNMTASWVRAKATSSSSTSTASNSASGTSSTSNNPELCSFFETFSRNQPLLPQGVYSLEDLKVLGSSTGTCPYFLARYAINHANVLVYNYQYMLDPKIASLISANLDPESIVVFDEAHNIDNVCIEALSAKLTKTSLEASSRALGRLGSKVNELKASDAGKLRKEYEELVQGLRGSRGNANSSSNGASSSTVQAATDVSFPLPVLSAELLAEAVPGNIRKADHFLSFMRKVIVYLKQILQGVSAEQHTPLAFLHALHAGTGFDRKTLKYSSNRLQSLLTTLEVTSLLDLQGLQDLAHFLTLSASYMDGFAVLLTPSGTDLLAEQMLQLVCLDASIAIAPVFARYRVILTSGTLSPLPLYAKLLAFNPVVTMSLPMTACRQALLPLLVSRGNDQISLSTRFDLRGDTAILRNYGALLLDICTHTPDGVIAFFTSYHYMESTLTYWEEVGVLKDLQAHKLCFIETKDILETSLALDNYRRACDSGRGALFLAIARGKVAEGIDFHAHYGRTVVVLGIPYQYSLSLTLRARMAYLRTTYGVSEGDFLTFDAMRQVAQCIGRCIRSKTDYGVVVLADARFNRTDKRTKLPAWVLQFVRESSLNLSADIAMEQMKQFFRVMGQPIEAAALRTILYDEQQAAAWARRDFLAAPQARPASEAVEQMVVDVGPAPATPPPHIEGMTMEVEEEESPPPPPPEDSDQEEDFLIPPPPLGGSPDVGMHAQIEGFGKSLFLFEDILDVDQ